MSCTDRFIDASTEMVKNFANLANWTATEYSSSSSSGDSGFSAFDNDAFIGEGSTVTPKDNDDTKKSSFKFCKSHTWKIRLKCVDSSLVHVDFVVKQHVETKIFV